MSNLVQCDAPDCIATAPTAVVEMAITSASGSINRGWWTLMAADREFHFDTPMCLMEFARAAVARSAPDMLRGREPGTSSASGGL